MNTALMMFLQQNGEEAAGLFGGLIGLAIGLFLLVAMWKIYTKAGQPGWAIIIPIYNIYVLLQIVGRPTWWILLMFIPLVNFIIAIMIYIDLAKSFGKSTLFGLGLIFLSFIFIPILGFGDAEYRGPAALL
ncbi:MAG: DUF5684 domain-containing protein [Ardenticatenaceae bacterium]